MVDFYYKNSNDVLEEFQGSRKENIFFYAIITHNLLLIFVAYLYLSCGLLPLFLAVYLWALSSLLCRSLLLTVMHHECHTSSLLFSCLFISGCLLS